MAETVGGKSPKVTKGPTRAAKGSGAGKSKPKAAASVLPRQPFDEKKKPTTAGPGHNSGDTQADMDRRLREQRQTQLIALRTQHRAVDTKLDAAREVVAELNGDRKLIRSAIETAGYPLDEYDRAEKDAKSSRIDLAAKERIRAELREAFGIPVGPQDDLFTAPNGRTVPDASKGAIFWEAEGYRIGLSAPLDPESQFKGPPENLQDFLRGLEQAADRNNKAFLAYQEMKKQGETPKVEARDDDGSDILQAKDADEARKLISEATDEALKEAARTIDVDDDLPRDDLEAAVLEALGYGEEREKTPAELRKEEARVKESLAQLGTGTDAETEEAPIDAVPPEATNAAPGSDGFEASEEELQAQIGRRVLQEQQAAETPDPVV